MQSRWVRPVKSAEAHIKTRCSALLELTGDKIPGADALLGPPKRAVAILAFTSTTQWDNQKTANVGNLNCETILLPVIRDTNHTLAI
jgi:hypothetical protein